LAGLGWRSGRLCGRLRLITRDRRSPDLNLAALLQLVLAIGDHHVARSNSAGDIRHVLLREGDSDRTNIGVVIGLRHKNVGALRTALNGGGRDHRAVLANLQKEVDIDELVWPQGIFFIVEYS